MIGDSNTGKTSILLRYTTDSFPEIHHCTLGVDFKTKNIKIDNKVNARLQIWDTAGQERFRSVSNSYFRNSAGCLAVYDITNRNSFESLEI